MNRDERARQPAGVWIPWDLAVAFGRLYLKPPSRWQVFLVVLSPWCRYGEAWLTISEISERTGLCKRAAQAALSDLIAQGILKRVGRYGKLVVVPEAITTRTGNNDPGSDDDGLNDGRRHDQRVADPSRGPSRPYLAPATPANRGKATFTPKQRNAIENCFAEATELLGKDARDLLIPEHVTASLGLGSPVTYGSAYQILDREGRRAAGRAFVGAVLKLREDERVQGRELDSSISE